MVLVSPPLPGIITQHRHGTGDCASERHGTQGIGRSENDEAEYKNGNEHDDGSSSDSTSGSEVDDCWSDDEPERESPSRLFLFLGFGYSERRNTMLVVFRSRVSHPPTASGTLSDRDNMCARACPP